MKCLAAEPYTDLQFCSSCRIPVRVYQVMNLHIFIHGLDMFSLSAMKGILEPEKENGVSIFNVDVENIKSLSTETNPKLYPDYFDTLNGPHDLN